MRSGLVNAFYGHASCQKERIGAVVCIVSEGKECIIREAVLRPLCTETDTLLLVKYAIRGLRLLAWV